MSSNHSRRMMRASLHLSICVIGIVSLFAIPANAQHVHQLLYNNYNWTDGSLFGQPAFHQNDYWYTIGAFTTTPNNQLHIYYVGADSHIHQRTQSQKLRGTFGGPVWVDEDLTQETGAESIVTYNTSLAAFSEGNLQYVFYLPGKDGDVHMLSYDNSTWTDQDISLASGNPGECLDGTIAAFTTTPNNQIHVYYRGINYEVRQLFFNGTTWSDENLTAESGGSSSYGAWWSGFSIGNYQYLFYADLNFHLHELYYNNVQWNDVDLSNLIGAKEVSESLTAFVVPGTQTMEVFYGTTPDNHIYQISSSDNESWSQQDLTQLTNGPIIDPFVPVTGFATTPNNQLHVYYASGALHVNQLFFNGSSWSNQDLTSIAHAGNAEELEGMAGFSIGNYQYVYYVGK